MTSSSIHEPPQAATYGTGTYWKDRIVSGAVTAIVRVGVWGYKAGHRLVVVSSSNSWAVQADITSVKVKDLGELTQDDAKAAGYDDVDSLRDDLRAPFSSPDLGLSDPVTVVTFAV